MTKDEIQAAWETYAPEAKYEDGEPMQAPLLFDAGCRIGARSEQKRIIKVLLAIKKADENKMTEEIS